MRRGGKGLSRDHVTTLTHITVAAEEVHQLPEEDHRGQDKICQCNPRNLGG